MAALWLVCLCVSNLTAPTPSNGITLARDRSNGPWALRWFACELRCACDVRSTRVYDTCTVRRKGIHDTVVCVCVCD